MKKYTQKEFNNFEIIDGIRQCPSGDYTEIKVFGEWCSFGGWCSFNIDCIVEGTVKLKEFLKFEGFGSEKRAAYFFQSTDNEIYVRCGCFFGDIEQFIAKVQNEHGQNKLAQGYLKVAELAKWQFEYEPEKIHNEHEAK